MTSTLRTTLRKSLPPVLIAAFGVWLLVGCIYVPTFNKLVGGKDATRQVGAEKSNRPIRVGRAARGEVERVLGVPSRVSADGRRTAYTWTVLNGLWVFPICFQAYPQKEARTLVLTFDADDVLVSYDVTKNPQNLLTSGGPELPVLPGDFYRTGSPRPSSRPATQATRPVVN